MFGKTETHVVVLSDLEDAREAIRRAADGADPEEAPGLRRALELIDEVASAGVDPRARWVRGVLDAAGVDADAEEVRAVRAVRNKLPGLSLSGAVELVRAAKTGS